MYVISKMSDSLALETRHEDILLLFTPGFKRSFSTYTDYGYPLNCLYGY